MSNLKFCDYRLFSNSQVLEVCGKENLSYTQEGVNAIVFTAQGDLRSALNNLQSTAQGFGHISSENVFKVCDEPHPMLVKTMLEACVKQDIHEAYKVCITCHINLEILLFFISH